MRQLTTRKTFVPFVAGMMAMAILSSVVSPALAAGGQVLFNQVGIRVLREQKVEAGEAYTAPNGQKVPSSITYVDAAGGKTNYLSVRQVSDLLDADIIWNAGANSVDIGVASGGAGTASASSVSGTAFETADVPLYGVKIATLTEIDPNTVPQLNDGSRPARVYTQNTRIQYGFDSSFPEMTVRANPDNGQYLVFTVTNHGKADIATTVSRNITITAGRREMFPSVLVHPGDTLVRAFQIDEDAELLKSTFCFNAESVRDPSLTTDMTVSLMLY